MRESAGPRCTSSSLLPSLSPPQLLAVSYGSAEEVVLGDVVVRVVMLLVEELLSYLSVFWERGSPDLPACGLRRGSSGGLVRPIFISTNSRPSQGAKPRGADDTELPQAGPRGGGEIKAGYLTRCP